MTEGILERAKALLADLNNPYEIQEDGPGHWISEGRYKNKIVELTPELIAEVERLRSLNESLMENGNDLRTRCQKAEARTKELEADRIAYRNLGSRIEDLETYIERLEAAFLKLYVNQLVGCNMPREVAEKHAREALERIRNGE